MLIIKYALLLVVPLLLVCGNAFAAEPLEILVETGLYGSTRAEDGICELRGIFLSASQWCASFKDRHS